MSEETQIKIEEKYPSHSNEKEYEDAGKLTSFASSAQAHGGRLDREKTIKIICIALAVVVCGGLFINIASGGKKSKEVEDENGNAAGGVPDYLKRQRDRAMQGEEVKEGEGDFVNEIDPVAGTAESGGISAGNSGGSSAASPYYSGENNSPPYGASPAQEERYGGGSGGGGRVRTPAYSSMVPENVAGSIFAGSGNTAAARSNASTYAEQYPYMSGSAAAAGLSSSGMQASRQSAASAAQTNREEFYGNTSGGGSTLRGGYYIGADTLWIGTIIPAVLVTGINTDLPGEVIARVSENIYDSHTGKHLLIPQGTVLAARYNSSVSYAQHRVQIVWDELIRPDGYMLELEGMNAVDKAGASGQEAEYHENWFEYLKAAGIITLFSTANANMTEAAAKYSTSVAGNVAQANSQMVNQLGGNIIDRALDIKPTLTVESGTQINIMLNKNIYLPGVK
jgi:hypothetical protein